MGYRVCGRCRPDQAEWKGVFRQLFPTYHDLNIRQLRGYFTWRTSLREGKYRPAPAPMVFIYLYELLCGIGTSSPEDSLRKMEEFETAYLGSGYGQEGMEEILRDVAENGEEAAFARIREKLKKQSGHR